MILVATSGSFASRIGNGCPQRSQAGRDDPVRDAPGSRTSQSRSDKAAANRSARRNDIHLHPLGDRNISTRTNQRTHLLSIRRGDNVPGLTSACAGNAATKITATENAKSARTNVSSEPTNFFKATP